MKRTFLLTVSCFGHKQQPNSCHSLQEWYCGQVWRTEPSHTGCTYSVSWSLGQL